MNLKHQQDLNQSHIFFGVGGGRMERENNVIE